MNINTLRKNFFMYSIRTLLNIIFGIIIFPYVAKLLGPILIGKVQYVESIVGYFILFINLGVLNYGKREVAFFRDDKIKLSKVVIELLCILFVTTCLALMIYFYMIYNLEIFKTEQKIFFIFSFYLLFNFLGVEWFYEGIENQTYITVRNIVLKFISGLLIIFFVKNNDDIYIYAAIIVFSLIGFNILNFIRLFKYIKIKEVNIRLKDLVKHLHSLFFFFSSTLAVSLSYNLDTIMIAKLNSIEEVGYYSFASKIGKVPIVFPTAIVTIFYPRLCNFIQNGKYDEYIKMVKKALNFILLLSIPSSVGLYLISDLIVLIFGGVEYSPAIKIMKVFAIYIFVISLALYTGSLTLLANKMEKFFLYSLIIGSLLNCIFNIVFISKLGGFGAAIATIITEIVAIFFRYILAKNLFIKIGIFDKNFIRIIVSAIVIIPIVEMVKRTITSNLIAIIFSIILGGIGYLIMLLTLKEKITREYIYEVRSKIKYFITK